MKAPLREPITNPVALIVHKVKPAAVEEYKKAA